MAWVFGSPMGEFAFWGWIAKRSPSGDQKSFGDAHTPHEP